MKKNFLRQKFRIRLFFEGAAVGILTGIIISALRYAIDLADIYRPLWLKNLSSVADFFVTFAAIIFLSKFLSFAMEFDNQVGGSGVPQIKKIIQGKTEMLKPLRLLILKFFSVLLAISTGMSLGRAGVSVQFGACVGEIFSAKNKILLAAGASAGFAAIFSAPLAGVIFCIEELHKKFTAETLVATTAASISAAAVAEILFGVRPIFETITAVQATNPLKHFFYFIMLAIFIGILGAIFTKSLLIALKIYERLQIKLFYKILIPLILIVPVGKFFPEILGCGNVLVDDLLSKKFLFATILIFFAGKFLFTLICFGTNAPGGIFLPLLTVGALGGNIFAEIGMKLNFFSCEWTTLFIIFGMAAMFAAVVKSPITGSILILELTGQFSYLLPLILVSVVAFIISDICGGEPIFSALMNRKKFFK